ncbi:hypothetical protein [Nocardia asteroides]|uniref:hypothetical protein n=1 Tax=Nocardia asteroides TaxID=1824 RepID=UPI0033FD647D
MKRGSQLSWLGTNIAGLTASMYLAHIAQTVEGLTNTPDRAQLHVAARQRSYNVERLGCGFFEWSQLIQGG